MDGAEQFRLARGPVPGLLAVRAVSARSFARHSHEVHGIGTIDAGGQRSASGSGPVQALCGDLITVNPGEVHDGRPMGNENRRWRMLYLDFSLLNQEHSNLEWQAPVLRDARLRSAFERLYRRSVGGAGALAVDEALADLLHCAPWAQPGSAARTQVPSAALARVRERLASTDLPAPRLADLAHETGQDRFALLRAFRGAYGLPPHAWVLQLRLARAQGLILQGHGLADAALATGFADQSHMTRTFRRFRGYTPGDCAACTG